MEISELGLKGLLIFGLVAVLRNQAVIAFRVLWVWVCAQFRGREYNLDNQKDTADWCEGFNPGDGTWGLLKINEYRLLGVRGEMKDSKGEIHPRDIPILDWILGKVNRRHISKEQKRAIEAAGNDWPKD